MSDDKDRTGIRQLTEYEEDWARDYWYSEHHRFEYSEYSEVLCDIDPLSYHSMGLAVPGTFIEKCKFSFVTVLGECRQAQETENCQSFSDAYTEFAERRFR